MNKVRLTYMEMKKKVTITNTTQTDVYPNMVFWNRATHQVILLVLHFGCVPSHAVHRE